MLRKDRRRRGKEALPWAVRLAPLVCMGWPISNAFGAGEGLPNGGSVASGTATIGAPSAGSLTINQSSQRAIINWNEFSIGASRSVTIRQPGANAAILNRVDGNRPSTIAGDLKANGQVFLVNPNGIAITPSGSVNVGGGFVASTLGISNGDFNAGRLEFSGNGASAGVSNAGTIRTAPGGFVGLLGGQVSHSGTIVAPVGKVGIGAGERATLDLNGNGFLQVVTPTDPAGRSGALIDISGKVVAPGGRVEIRAATAQRAIHDVVNLPGSISASSARREGGVIVLDGGDGTTRVSGSVSAASQTSAGGDVAIRGRTVTMSGARVNATGATGGGRVAIRAAAPAGTGAATIDIDASTSIRADAAASGNGGAVSIIGDVTRFAGRISAQALGPTGDGGSAEVSGGTLDYSGTTTLLSRHGTTGTLLLDPYNVTISTGTDVGTAGFDATATGARINTTTLQNALATANVNVTTGSSGAETGNITVANPISWASNSTLTLTAAGGIILNAGITNSNGASGLTLIANGTGGISGAGTLANSGALTLNVANAGGTGTLSGIISGGGSLTKLGSGTVSLSGANTYTGGTTVSAGMLVDTVTATQNAIGTGAASIASGAVLKLNNTAAADVTIGTSFTGAGQLNLNFNNSNVSNTIMDGAFGMSGQIVLSNSAATGNKWTLNNVASTTAASLTVNLGNTLFVSGGTPTFSGGITVSGTGNNEGFGGLRVENGAVLGGNVSLMAATTFGMRNTGTATISGNIAPGVSGAVTLTTATSGLTLRLPGTLSNGAGTLSLIVGQAGTTQLSGSNAYTGGTTINAGTLRISGSGSLGAGSYAGAIAVASGAALQYSSSAAQTLAGVISGAGSLTKDTGTTSTLTLNGANTYTGTTTIAAGTLTAGTATAFGTGAISIGATAATLAVAGPLTIANTITLTGANGTISANVSGQTVLSGVISGTGGLSLGAYGNLTATGGGDTGNLLLSGTNTFTGTSIITSGLLNGASSFGAAGNALALNGGGLAFATTTTVARNISLGAAGGYLRAYGGTTGTVSGVLSGTGALTTTDAGTVSLTGANTYTGPTTVSAGTLKAGSTSAFGTNSALTLLSAGSLDLNGRSVAVGSLAGAGGTVTNGSVTAATLTTGGNGSSTSFAGAIQNGAGTVALTKAGAGVQTLAGANTYTGATTIGAGTLTLSGSWNVGAATATTSVASGALLNGAGVLTAATLQTSGAGTISLTGANVIGAIASSGTIGAFTLNDAHTVSLGSMTSSGAIAVTTAGGAFDITIGAGATLTTSGAAITLTAAQSVIDSGSINTGGGNLGISAPTGGSAAAITLTGATINVGAGTGTLSGSSTSNYGIDINGATSTLTAATGSLTLNGQTVTPSVSFGSGLDLNASLVTSGTIALIGGGSGSGHGVTLRSGVSITSNGALSLDGSTGAAVGNRYGVYIVGGNTVTASAGPVSITAAAAAGNAIQANGTSFVNNGASGFTVAGTSNAGTGFNVAASTSISTSGAVTLSGNSASGADWIFAGGNTISNGAGALTLAATGTSGFKDTSTVTFNTASGATTTVNGAIVSTGGLALTGAGLLTLNSANTFSGSTAIGGGTLAIASAGSLGGGVYGGAISIASGATLRYASSAAQVLSGAISGAGQVTKDTSAGSTLTLSGADTYTGATTVGAGTLTLSGSLNVGSSNTVTTVVASGATLNGAGTVTAGVLSASGAGTLTLTGGNAIGALATTGTVGAITVNDAQSIAVGSIASTGPIQITASGLAADLTLASGTTLSTSAAGDAITLAAGGAFINNAGSSALSTSNGRWLVYSATPAGDTFGALDSNNPAVWNVAYASAPPASVSQAGNRYLFAYQPTITFTSTSGTKVYGTDVTAAIPTMYTASARQGGVAGAFLGDTSVAAFSGTPTVTSAGAAASAGVAGSPYTVSITAGSLVALNGYALAYTSSGTLTIAPAPLTVTARDAAKTYDGLSYSGGNGVLYAGLVNGETPAVLGGSLTYGGTAQGAVNAGSYSLSASGLTSANYSITYTPGTLAVSPAALSITARDATKTYDGLAYSGGNGVLYAGLVNGETPAVLGGSLTYGGTAQGAVNAGSYSLTASGLASANYTIAYAPGMLSVSPAPLTVTARDAAKIYDGLGYGGGNGVLYAGLVNGETPPVLGGTLAYGGTAQGAVNAGSYSLTASGLASANYTIAYSPGTLSVTRAALTVTARDAAKTYDGLSYSGGNGVLYAGLVNGETPAVLGGSLTYGGTAQGAVNAGSYSLTASGLASANYTIAYAPGMLSVSPAPLTVTARDVAKIYDGLGYGGGDGVLYAGLVNGETPAVLGGSLAYSGTAQGAVNAGGYTLTASGLTSANYTIAYAPGRLSVSPALLTVTARDTAKIYDGLGYGGGDGVLYAGLVNGETPAVLGGSLAYGGTAQGAVNAGAYSLTASGLTSSNYSIAYAPGALRVSPAPLVVTARDASKTYDGLGYGGGNGVLYAGLVNGETPAVLGGSITYGGTAQGAVNAGSYSLTVSGLTSANYTIAYAPGMLSVSPAPLTVTARDVAKIYDGLSYGGGNGVSLAGLVNGETSAVLGGSLTYGGTAQGAVNAGSYSLTASGLTSANYTIAYAAGRLSVSPALLTVTARDAAKIYDGLGYGGGDGVLYAGLVNGETPAVLGGSLAYGGSAQGAVNAGSYSLSASGLASANYTIAYSPGMLSVTRAALTVTARDTAKTYDGLSYSGGNGVLYAGLVNGETPAVLGGSLAYGGSAQGAVNAGSYSLSASGLASSNYSITYTPGTLAVSPAALSITARDAAKTYDGLNYSGGNGVSFAGLVNGETSAVLGGSLTYGGTAQGAVNAGSYSMTASGLTSANYNIVYAPGTLTITPAALTVTAFNDAKTYDGLGYSGGSGVLYAGLVHGETPAVLDGTLAYGGTAQGAFNAGNYSLTASGLTSANYAIAYAAGTLSVNRAPLTVTARNAVKTYDGVSYGGGNGVSLAGLVNGETSAVLGGSLTYGGTAQGAVNAGSYSLTASGLTSSNYTIAYAPGTLAVSPAALTVFARDAVKTYDGLGYAGGNGVLYAGLVNGETPAVLGGSITYGGTAQGAVNAGSYSLTASGLTSANYTIAYAPGMLSVSPAPLTVTARDVAKIYDGLSYGGGTGVSLAGLVNGETSAVLGGSLTYGGTAQGAVNAGSYSLTASGLTSSNYTIAYAPGTLAVSPAALSITARDAAKTYDGLSYSGGNGVSYAGLVNGETPAVLGGSLAYGGTARGAIGAGNYSLTASGLTSSNYTIAYAPGMLSIHVPSTPSVDVPSTPSVGVPGAPSVDVPGAPSVDVPGAPSVDVPGAPSVDVPGAPSVDVPGAPSVDAQPLPSRSPPSPAITPGRDDAPVSARSPQRDVAEPRPPLVAQTREADLPFIWRSTVPQPRADEQACFGSTLDNRLPEVGCRR